MKIRGKRSEPEKKDDRYDKNDKKKHFCFCSRTFFIRVHAFLVALKRAPTVNSEVLNPVFPRDSTLRKPACCIKSI
jgi:hypothetical protein